MREQLDTTGIAAPEFQREEMIRRAQKTLRMRRTELERQIAQLKDRMEMKDEILLAKLFYRDILRDLEVEIADRMKRLELLPEVPIIETLAYDGDSGIPVTALAPGKILWFVNKQTGVVTQDLILRVAFSVDGVRYRMRHGAEVLHQVAGVVCIHPENLIPALSQPIPADSPAKPRVAA
ncbi:hypothetical protein [Sinimarinibacterium sp. CAU 1509]|uniref:hypothetical protein n=1 Tax=Sinimarinibacterium sp. CAU 1509 TaxID=2562283 RepID=UPI001B7FB47E|nr:hypothetical protein [Sinimarinibacterium sp. CAU 1509]